VVLLNPRSQNGTTGSDSQVRGLRCELETPTQSHMRKEPVMSKVRFIGLDVHANTIAVAIAEPSGEVRSVGVIRWATDLVPEFLWLAMLIDGTQPTNLSRIHRRCDSPRLGADPGVFEASNRRSSRLAATGWS
jgi:hypothetical protein